MNYLLFLLSLLLSGTQAAIECNTLPEFIYELPNGFAVSHTFKENGLFGAVDEFGNGINVYVEYGEFLVENSSLKVVDEERYEDGSYLLIVDNPVPIDPYNAIFVVPKGGFTVQAYFYELGDPQTHSVFQDNAMNLARSFAQGGRDGNSWKDCIWNVFDLYVDRNFGESCSPCFSAL